MKNSIISSITIAFRKKSFWIALFIMIAYVFINYFTALSKMKGWYITDIFSPSATYALSDSCDLMYYFRQAFPFLIVLPAGFLIISEIRQNVITTFRIRDNYKNYYISKYISGFLITFCTFFVPFVLSYVIHSITFDFNIYQGVTTTSAPMFSEYGPYYWGISMIGFFYKYPTLYNITRIMMVSCFCGVAACFTMAFADVCRLKIKIFAFWPVYLVMTLSQNIAQKANNEEFNLFNYIPALCNNRQNYAYFALVIFIMIICIINFTRLSIKRRENYAC